MAIVASTNRKFQHFFRSLSFSFSSSSNIIFHHEDLEQFSQRIFLKLGFNSSDATLIGNCLVKSNLRNQDGHGVSRISMYAKRIKHGLVKVNPAMKLKQVATNVFLLDGDNGYQHSTNSVPAQYELGTSTVLTLY